MPILFDRHWQLDALVLTGKQVVRMEVGSVSTEQDGNRAAGFREAHTLRTGLDGPPSKKALDKVAFLQSKGVVGYDKKKNSRVQGYKH